MIVAADLALRPADMRDAYALWLWANDAITRRAAFDRPLIEWSEHVQWIQETLQSPWAHVWIAALADGRPVGSLRFDTQDHWTTARLSYVVAAEARRQGIGRLLVAEAPTVLADEHPGAQVFATVADGNEPSLRIFRSLGWRPAKSGGGRCVFVPAPEPGP